MAKKWRCTVCGYIHEGPEAPDQCPMCKVGKEKFVEVVEQEGNLEFVTEHVIGDGKGASKELWEGLQNHFMGECTEVGMYLAMSRQADREGYPEIAEAYKRYAWEEAEHASKFAELIGEVVWDTKTNLYKRMNAESGACEDKMRLARSPPRQRFRRPLQALFRQIVLGIALYAKRAAPVCRPFHLRISRSFINSKNLSVSHSYPSFAARATS